jgi:IS5 family transposase
MQATFSYLEYAAKKRVTPRDRFRSEIDTATPWSALIAENESFYPKGDGRGRPPIGVQPMRRMYIALQCSGLSDEGIEDAIYDNRAIRGICGIELDLEAAPDVTNLLKCRRLMETNKLTDRIFTAINVLLAAKGLLLKEGTEVDAAVFEVPSSAKINDGARDPEMHQTKKGYQRHFGMKAHIGVEADLGLTHTLVTTATNVSNINQAHALLHGDESAAFRDADYQFVEKRRENQRGWLKWNVALRLGKRSALLDTMTGRLREQLEKLKASVRAKIKHPFNVVKNTFGTERARYCGLAKNTAQLYTLFGLANLMSAKRRSLVLHAQGTS